MTPDEILAKFCKKLVALDMDIFGLRKEGAQDAEVWRTIGAKGGEGGSHVLIDSSTGEIKAGLNGKYKGMTVGEMKKKSNAESRQKKVASSQVVTKNIKSSDKLVQSFSALIESMNYEGKKFIGSISPSLKKKIEEGIKINNEYLKKVQKAQTENEKKKLIEEFMDKNMDVLESNYLKEQEEIEQAIKQSEKTNNKFKSEKISIPNLPKGSTVVSFLETEDELVTKKNSVGDDDSRYIGKHGFEQETQPTENDLKASGYYSSKSAPTGYWDAVPHVATPHPGLVPLEKGQLHDFDYDDIAEQENYSLWAHNNVPNASRWGSPSGRAAAYSYTAHSNVLNDSLRDGIDTDSFLGSKSADKKNWKDDSIYVTKELDKMFASARVKEPMVVYRGMNHFEDESEFLDMYKKGAVVESKSFGSTSVNPTKSKIFANSADGIGLVKIRVPKGASALSLRYKADGDDFSEYAIEDEILLPRNTKYKVVGFEKGKGDLEEFTKIPILEIVS